MAIRSYRPATDHPKIVRNRNAAKKPGKKQKYKPYTPVKASHISAWQKKMPSLSRDLIESAIYNGNEWILYTMAEQFDDPKRIADKFFTWCSLLIKKIGRDKIKLLIQDKANLYVFLQEYQKILNEQEKATKV